MENKQFVFYSNKKIFALVNILILIMLFSVLLNIFTTSSIEYKSLFILFVLLVYILFGMRYFRIKISVHDKVKIKGLYTIFLIRTKLIKEIKQEKGSVIIICNRGRIDRKIALPVALLQNSYDETRAFFIALKDNENFQGAFGENITKFIRGETDSLSYDNYCGLKGSLIILTAYIIYSAAIDTAAFAIALFLRLTIEAAFLRTILIVIPAVNILFGLVAIVVLLKKKKAAIAAVKISRIVYFVLLIMLLFASQIPALTENFNLIIVLSVLLNAASGIVTLMIVFTYLNTSERVKQTLNKGLTLHEIIIRAKEDRRRIVKSIVKAVAAILISLFIVFGTYIMISNAKINGLFEKDKHYEAFSVLQKRSFEKLCSKYDTPQMKYYYAMALHEPIDEALEVDWKLPDFTGWSAAEVALALRNIGQEYEIVFMDEPKAGYNHVISQSPTAGELSDPDRPVVLTVNSYYSNFMNYEILLSRNVSFAETGEWIYWMKDGDVYKSRIDFKNAEKIYHIGDAEFFSGIKLMGRKGDLYIFNKLSYYTDEPIKIVFYSQINKNAEVLNEFYDVMSSEMLGGIIKLNKRGENDTRLVIEYNPVTCEVNEYEDNWFRLETPDGGTFYVDYKSKDNHVLYYNNGENKTIGTFEKTVIQMCYIDEKLYLRSYNPDGSIIFSSVYEYNTETEKISTIYENNQQKTVERIHTWREYLYYLQKPQIYSMPFRMHIYNSITGESERMFINPEIGWNFFASEEITQCGNYFIYISSEDESKDIYFNLLTESFEGK